MSSQESNRTSSSGEVKYSFVASLLAESAAGMAIDASLFPLDTIKTGFQVVVIAICESCCLDLTDLASYQ